MFPTKRLVALSIIGLLLFLAVVPALAAGTSDQQRQIQDIRRQMQIQQNRAAEAQRTVNSVSDRLQAIQQELDAASSEYENIKLKLAETELQIENNTQILATAEENLAQRTQILNKRVRDIYKNGQISYIDVLLGANDFGDFTTRVDLLRRVIKQDINLIAKVKAERELVLQKKAQLETDRQAIVELQKQAEEKKNVIESRKAEQEDVLSSAVNERDTAEQAYQELQDTSKRIEEMIRSRESGSVDSGGGSGVMIWPVSGQVTSPFGWRTHPIFGTPRFHSGLDIAAGYGQTIVAADSGVVSDAGWMGGYGKATIINHGGGISSLYGHQSVILVSVGQRVAKGQVIGQVGSTGYSTGPHLHFEVRKNGSPVSPLSYLP